MSGPIELPGDPPVEELVAQFHSITTEYGLMNDTVVTGTLRRDERYRELIVRLDRLIAYVPGQKTVSVPAGGIDYLRSLLPRWMRRRWKWARPRMRTLEPRVYLPKFDPQMLRRIANGEPEPTFIIRDHLEGEDPGELFT